MARPGRCLYRGRAARRRTQEAGLAAAPGCSPTFSHGRGRGSLESRAGSQKRALQEARQVTMWENNHAEETKDRLGWNHTRYPNNSQGAEEAAQTHEKTPRHAAQEVPRDTRQGR